eukprot:TRINITY_DN4974_c0_g1_i1.p1 TRINITY_DN4974_c0_g1~~TRINITY_DN4974_c0_g1_i1.p1  ORF type:complete len:598 (-),score=135.49 TRINITY_DN4974_c0_g1_i1:62-1855(-)
MSVDLRTALGTKLLSHFNSRGEYRQLICDKQCMRIISSCLTNSDLVENHIAAVESLHISRQPLRQMDAVYFISSKKDSVLDMLQDFPLTKNRKNKIDNHYKGAHVLFCEAAPDNLMSLIADSNMIDYVKSCQEINLNYLALESRVFSLNSPNDLHHLYSGHSTLQKSAQMKTASQLATLCCSLNETPMIRYCAEHVTTRQIANYTQEYIDTMRRTDPCAPTGGTLMVVDRISDTIAPLLHELTYQAMVEDLLDIDNGILKYTPSPNSAAREVILDDKDEIWVRNRHKHIAEAIVDINKEFSDFSSTNKAAIGHGKDVSLAEMSQLIRAVPEFREQIMAFETHITACDDCMTQFKKQKVEECASLEQDMATGKDVDGKSVKNVASRLSNLLRDPKIAINSKLRLSMIHIITSEGISASEKDSLVKNAVLSPEEQDVLANLSFLNVSLAKGPNHRKDRKHSKSNRPSNRDVSYDLSRFQPSLRDVAEDFLGDTLSEELYPFTRKPTADQLKLSTGQQKKKTSASWASKGKEKVAKSPAGKPPLIIYVTGGLTFSEARVAYELSEQFNRPIVIGGPRLIKPVDFLDAVKSLNKPLPFDEE